MPFFKAAFGNWQWEKCVYAVAVLLRLGCVWSLGMIHPDEFFQSQEVMATSIFQLQQTHVPWEFNLQSPNRSILFPSIVVGLPYLVVREMAKYLGLHVTGSMLLFLPRIILFCLSFLFDYVICQICNRYKIDTWSTLLTFSTSWTTMAFLTRPFSNTAEAHVLALTLYVLLVTDKYRLVGGMVRRSVAMGCLLAVGTFTRFTFIFFFFPCGLYLVFDNLLMAGNNHFKKDLGQPLFSVQRLLPMIKTLSEGLVGFTAIALICIVMDTIYFKSPIFTIQHLLKISWVCSPWNNLLYNLDSNNLADHGIHPRSTHALVNMFLLFGPLTFFLYRYGIFTALMKSSKSKIQALFVWCSLCPLFFLSMAPHQEPRFLLPMLLPLTFLYGESIFAKKNAISRKIGWLMLNAVALLFFCFIHQAGVVPSLISLGKRSLSARHRNIVYYHTYMPPRFLLAQQNNKTTVVDMAGSAMEDMERKIKELWHVGKSDATTYVVCPGSLNISSKLLASHQIDVKLIDSFWPHISTEDFPQHVDMNDWKKMTSLEVYQIEHRQAKV